MPSPLLTEVSMTAGDQDAVQKGKFDLGKIQGHHNPGAVQVGGDDVCLPREVGGAPDQVVAAGQNLGDDGVAVGVTLVVHPVSHGQGIGDFTGFEADFSAQYGLEHLPFRQGGEEVVASGIFDYGGFHIGHKNTNFCSFVAISVQFGRKTGGGSVGNRPKMVTFVQLTHRL